MKYQPNNKTDECFDIQTVYQKHCRTLSQSPGDTASWLNTFLNKSITVLAVFYVCTYKHTLVRKLDMVNEISWSRLVKLLFNSSSIIVLRVLSYSMSSAHVANTEHREKCEPCICRSAFTHTMISLALHL